MNLSLEIPVCYSQRYPGDGGTLLSLKLWAVPGCKECRDAVTAGTCPGFKRIQKIFFLLVWLRNNI